MFIAYRLLYILRDAATIYPSTFERYSPFVASFVAELRI